MSEPNWADLPPAFKTPVERLRKAAGEGTVSAVVNGRHPRDWSLERWLALGTFIFAAVSSSVAAVLFIGGEYRRITDNLDVLSNSVPALTQAVGDVSPQLYEIRSEQRILLRQIEMLEAFHAEQLGPLRSGASTPAAADRQPAFPRDDRFAMEPAP